MSDKEYILNKENRMESEKLRYKAEIVRKYFENNDDPEEWGYVFIYPKNERYPDEENEFEFTLERWEELKKNIPKIDAMIKELKERFL